MDAIGLLWKNQMKPHYYWLFTFDNSVVIFSLITFCWYDINLPQGVDIEEFCEQVQNMKLSELQIEDCSNIDYTDECDLGSNSNSYYIGIILCINFIKVFDFDFLKISLVNWSWNK